MARRFRRATHPARQATTSIEVGYYLITGGTGRFTGAGGRGTYEFTGAFNSKLAGTGIHRYQGTFNP